MDGCHILSNDRLKGLISEKDRKYLEAYLPIMINHFNKINAEGKLNLEDRTFGDRYDMI